MSSERNVNAVGGCVRKSPRSTASRVKTRAPSGWGLVNVGSQGGFPSCRAAGPTIRAQLPPAPGKKPPAARRTGPTGQRLEEAGLSQGRPPELPPLHLRPASPRRHASQAPAPPTWPRPQPRPSRSLGCRRKKGLSPSDVSMSKMATARVRMASAPTARPVGGAADAGGGAGAESAEAPGGGLWAGPTKRSPAPRVGQAGRQASWGNGGLRLGGPQAAGPEQL